jgi:hypothetical protein
MNNICICSFIAIFVGVFSASAQKPQYYNKYDVKMASRWALLQPVDSVRSGRSQVIFHPSDFAGAPASRMMNVYVRFGGSPVPGSGSGETIYPDFTIKMGHTGKTNWAPTKDTFVNGLIMVHHNPTWKRKFYLDSIGTWVKFPINAGDFNYDPNRRFVVEFSSEVPRFYIIIGSNVYTPNGRILKGFRDSLTGVTTGLCPDFGFDLAPTAVEQLAGLSSLGLFPNPAPGGRVNLTFETNHLVSRTEVYVLDYAGRKVWTNQYSGFGTSFFQELNLKGLAPGQYTLNLILDGAVVSRKLIIL